MEHAGCQKPMHTGERAFAYTKGRMTEDLASTSENPAGEQARIARMRHLTGTLQRLEEKLRAGGGAQRIAKQHSAGKLTARERITELLDPGTRFVEIGLLIAYDLYEGQAPAAGVVTGIGTIEGRAAVVVANDATVKAGAWWPETINKILRAQEVAMRNRVPIVYLVDSAGVNLPYQDGIFPGQYGAGRIFYYNSLMRRKLRVSLLLQPLATALFANSPFTEGKPNGFLSYRAYVWTDTDNQRSGIPKVMFEDGFGFERYAGWLIENVPMYFVYRDGGYIDVAGESFTAYTAGRVPALSGVTATMGDFADHVTTAFTDVRLKRFLEMRGADAGRADMMLAQSALWVGLLYDDAALSAAEALLRGAGWEDAIAARAAVPRQGLAAAWRGGTLRDIAGDVVAIAKDGLRARRRLNASGADEQSYLDPLSDIAAGAPTQAEHWLARYNGAWHGEIGRIFGEAAI